MPSHPGLLLTSTSEVKIAKVTSQGPSLTLLDIQKYLKLIFLTPTKVIITNIAKVVNHIKMCYYIYIIIITNL